MTKTEMNSRFIKLAGAAPMRAVYRAPFSPVLSREALVRRLQRGSACLTELGLEQRCPRCGEFWPWDSEFFGVASDATRLSSWCRGCLNEHYQQLRVAGRRHDSKAVRGGIGDGQAQQIDPAGTGGAPCVGAR